MHSFTFNLRFLYELKHKVRLSKSVQVIFHFRFHFVFIKVYIFVLQNAWTLWIWNAITPFKIKIIQKAHIVLLPVVWFLSCNSMISALVGAPQNWPGDKFFKTRKSKFWERLNSNNTQITSQYANILHYHLLNNLFISFLNLFISIIELKTLLNNLFISFLNQFISLIELKILLNNLFISYLNLFIILIKLKNIH